MSCSCHSFSFLAKVKPATNLKGYIVLKCLVSLVPSQNVHMAQTTEELRKEDR